MTPKTESGGWMFPTYLCVCGFFCGMDAQLVVEVVGVANYPSGSLLFFTAGALMALCMAFTARATAVRK